MAQLSLICQSEFHILSQLLVGNREIATLTILTGDRIFCCDEAIVAHEGGMLLGTATIAPQGEEQSGQPGIVGVCVRPEYRHLGLGKRLLLAAINRMQERTLPTPYRVDTVSKMGKRLVAQCSPEVLKLLEVHDTSRWSFE